jgi:hypothetical protein
MNPKKGRLLIDDIVLSGTKLIQTLEDFKLNSGTLIFIEFLNELNEWPSEKNFSLS